jgi:hypothetical protein
VKLRQPRHLQPAANTTLQLAKLRRRNTRVETRNIQELFGRERLPDKLGADNAYIELNVVTNELFRQLKITYEVRESIFQIDTFFRRTTCRNSVNLLGLKRNIEAIRPYNIVVTGEEFAFGIVKLPGQLHQPGPVVEICNRSRLIVRNPGGFRIEDQIHGGSKKSSGDVKIHLKTPKKKALFLPKREEILINGIKEGASLYTKD